MSYTFYVGGYTNTGGKGVYRAELTDGGKLNMIDWAPTASPTYLIFSNDKKYIFAANEARDVNGVPGGAVTAFGVASDGSLAHAVSRPTGGGQPCHVLEHFGYVYAANYGAGNISVYPAQGGLPGEIAFTHQHAGSGPNARRQEGPHAHCVMAVPGSDVFCAIDLGIDQARFYRMGDGALELVQALQFPGGAGPRHVVFASNGRIGWVVSELSNEVFTIEYSSEWKITAKCSTLPEGYAGRTSCAAIRLSGDEKLLAASNRGHDSAACFEADAATGKLSPIGIFPTGGEQPRDINFSPDGKWLLAANQESDLVTLLSVTDGFKLIESASLSVPKPACILF